MPLFSYKALSTNGTVATGEIEAADRPEALRTLDRRGLRPVNVKESAKVIPAKKKEAAPVRRKEKTGEKEEVSTSGELKLKRAEVILFT